MTVATDDTSTAQMSAVTRLKSMYPGCDFSLLSSSVVNGQWTGLYSVTQTPSQDAKPKPVRAIVVFSMSGDGDVDTPLKPFPHGVPAIIPVKPDYEDMHDLHVNWKSGMQGNASIVNDALSFKYRTETFALWNGKTSDLIISAGYSVYRCHIENDAGENATPDRDDILSCMNGE